jgi:choloylglycine hydrolase
MRTYLRRPRLVVLTTSIIIATSVHLPTAEACSRAVYFGKEGQTVTGRTMDWQEDMQSNLWIFPRGMDREGARQLFERR